MMKRAPGDDPRGPSYKSKFPFRFCILRTALWCALIASFKISSFVFSDKEILYPKTQFFISVRLDVNSNVSSK